jgi:hypothetical protein
MREAGQELEDLVPVGRGRDQRITVDRVDRCLNLVRTGLVSPQALPNDGLTFGNEVVIPTRAVLIG